MRWEWESHGGKGRMQAPLMSRDGVPRTCGFAGKSADGYRLAMPPRVSLDSGLALMPGGSRDILSNSSSIATDTYPR